MSGWIKIAPLGLDDPQLIRAAQTDNEVRNFLFWSRMPLVIRVDGGLPQRPALPPSPPHHVHGAARQPLNKFITAPS